MNKKDIGLICIALFTALGAIESLLLNQSPVHPLLLLIGAGAIIVMVFRDEDSHRNESLTTDSIAVLSVLTGGLVAIIL